ncbi:hypothetical protein [Microbacterium sp. P05]|uniref:hypothetical protein n=1 Tax=Microbacterium sp. P05 TaxID=3366948 RepID=UPI0037475D6A
MTGDTKVFVDPHAFTTMESDWARECVSLLQDFYGEVLAAVRASDRQRGMYLLGRLGESNEAHLGLSSAQARGSGVATGLATDIYDALGLSTAVISGILSEVQETVLFVEGIGHDRVSDMTINIIRRQLIRFTQDVCNFYGIPMVQQLDSGWMWDRHTQTWVTEHVELPMPNGKLLLVPLAVARKTPTFDPGDYLSHFVLPYLQEVELDSAHSTLVRRRTSRRHRGEKYVTKKSILERDPKPRKHWNNEATDQKPELLEDYRQAKAGVTEPPGHDDVASAIGTPPPDWDALLAAVLAVPPGREYADDYHRAVQHLLNALFYPWLDMPKRESKIHGGRKRIDIVYVNLAQHGFFQWLHTAGGVPAGQVVIECKNYSKALKNEEFDQLTGRFSPFRGQFGFLCYRGDADDKATVIARCRDAALDHRGFVIALDDHDLVTLVEARKAEGPQLFEYLLDRFQELI